MQCRLLLTYFNKVKQSQLFPVSLWAVTVYTEITVLTKHQFRIVLNKFINDQVALINILKLHFLFRPSHMIKKCNVVQFFLFGTVSESPKNKMQLKHLTKH